MKYITILRQSSNIRNKIIGEAAAFLFLEILFLLALYFTHSMMINMHGFFIIYFILGNMNCLNMSQLRFQHQNNTGIKLLNIILALLFLALMFIAVEQIENANSSPAKNVMPHVEIGILFSLLTIAPGIPLGNYRFLRRLRSGSLRNDETVKIMTYLASHDKNILKELVTQIRDYRGIEYLKNLIQVAADEKVKDVAKEILAEIEAEET